MNLSKYNKKVVEVVFDTRDELTPYLKKLDLVKMCKHNRDILRAKDNPTKIFIDGELVRHLHSVNYIYSSIPKSSMVLDFGFFIPIVPIVLSKLGYNVTTVEKLSYYDGALDELISLASKMYGIEIYDFDPLIGNNTDLINKFNVVLLSAVLEHLHGTPRYILDRVNEFIDPEGLLIVNVPNVANLINRYAMLKNGIPPFPEFENYYNSEYPFSGHNREYTISDLKYALDQSGFDITTLETFYHSAIKPINYKTRILHALQMIGPASWKPCIWAAAKPRKYNKS